MAQPYGRIRSLGCPTHGPARPRQGPQEEPKALGVLLTPGAAWPATTWLCVQGDTWPSVPWDHCVGVPRHPSQGRHAGHHSSSSPTAEGRPRPARRWGSHMATGTAAERSRPLGPPRGAGYRGWLSDPDSRVRDGCDPPWSQGCLPRFTTNLCQPHSRPTGEMAKG